MALGVATPTREQVDAAVRQTALDYVEGWYEGDPARMERSLHTDLAKRVVRPNDSPSSAWPPGDRLDEMSALHLVQHTRHERIPAHERGNSDVWILDRFENAASLKVGPDEYQHMALWNGRWVIINVLWDGRPKTPRDVDDAAITQAALDYVDGWYDGDAARMERCLHPELAKRIVISNGGPSGDRLDELSALGLVQLTRHEPTPAHERRSEVTLLDRLENYASVRVDASTWIDYMHLAKWNGRWAIVNVLWALRPETRTN
jgi:hypothetical protein